MPSPFPGFDPYLEAPNIWPDLHNGLATEISAELNRILPALYYARLDAVESAVVVKPIRHAFVEIRDPSKRHKLVTLIEIASPSNKRPGQDRRAYQQKQREVLDSDASLVEIDLLRNGQRLLPNMRLEEFVAGLDPQPDYLVSVNRAWRRIGDLSDYQLFPIGVRETLPCIPIPLTEHLSEPTLDLQWVFNQAYDRGPYRRGAVDYNQSPEPPLAEADRAWASQPTGGAASRAYLGPLCADSAPGPGRGLTISESWRLGRPNKRGKARARKAISRYNEQRRFIGRIEMFVRLHDFRTREVMYSRRQTDHE